MASHHYIEQLFTLVRTMKETNTAFVPIIFWLGGSGDLALALAPHQPGELIPTIEQTATSLTELEGPPVWMGIALDAYGRTAETDETGNLIPANTLDERFAAGDPRTVEQIMLFLSDPGEEVVIYRQVYRHSIVDGWEWDTIEQVINSILPDGNLIIHTIHTITN